MERRQKKRNKKSAWSRRGISVAICSRGLIYKSVRVSAGEKERERDRKRDGVSEGR